MKKINQKVKILISALFLTLVLNLIFGFVIIDRQGKKEFYLLLKLFRPQRNIMVLVKNPFNDTLLPLKLIGLPKDTILIKNGIAFINGKPEKDTFDLKFNYFIADKNCSIKNITGWEAQKFFSKKILIQKGWNNPKIFPYHYKYRWNEYFFGKYVIPYKNLQISSENMPLYGRTLKIFEPNSKNQFRKNYYFVINQNRAAKADSRYWGAIPKGYIKGRLIPIFRPK